MSTTGNVQIKSSLVRIKRIIYDAIGTVSRNKVIEKLYGVCLTDWNGEKWTETKRRNNVYQWLPVNCFRFRIKDAVPYNFLKWIAIFQSKFSHYPCVCVWMCQHKSHGRSASINWIAWSDLSDTANCKYTYNIFFRRHASVCCTWVTWRD